MDYFKNCYKIIDLRKILNERVKCYEEKFGNSDKIIETFYNTQEDEYWALINECRLYVQAKILIITTKSNFHVVPFGKIIGYDIIDLNGNRSTPLISATTTITKTDTGDIVKRAIIGGVVAGGVGALIGAATAKKTTTSSLSQVDEFRNLIRNNLNSTNLELIIQTDDIANPSIKIGFDGFENNAKELMASLNAIIKQNADNSIIDDSIIISETSNIENIGRKLGIEPSNPFETSNMLRQIEVEIENEKEKRLNIILGSITIAIVVAYALYLFCFK